VQTKSAEGAFSDEHFEGMVGIEIFRPFEMIFDLQHDRILLRRDPLYHSDPYRYVTIGIQLGKDQDGSYRVTSVWNHSPAQDAGLRVGDLIVAINGESVRSVGLEDVLARLHAKEGSSIKLTRDEGGQQSSVVMRTRQLLCGEDIE